MVPQSDGLNAVLKGFGPQSIFLKKNFLQNILPAVCALIFYIKNFQNALRGKLKCAVVSWQRGVFFNTWIYYKNVLILYRKAE